MRNLKYFVLSLAFVSNLALGSTGNLKGNCISAVLKKHPELSIIGTWGGNMRSYPVSGFASKGDKVKKFFCYFPYSHGSPKHVDVRSIQLDGPDQIETAKAIIKDRNTASSSKEQRRQNQRKEALIKKKKEEKRNKQKKAVRNLMILLVLNKKA